MLRVKLSANQSGAALMLGILLASAISLAIGLGLLNSGIATNLSAQTRHSGYQAQNFADACAEKALQKIRDNVSFTGNASEDIDGSSCNYTVVAGSDQNRTINASSTYKNATRRVQVTITSHTPKIIVNYWTEVLSF